MMSKQSTNDSQLYQVCWDIYPWMNNDEIRQSYQLNIDWLGDRWLGTISPNPQQYFEDVFVWEHYPLFATLATVPSSASNMTMVEWISKYHQQLGLLEDIMQYVRSVFEKHVLENHLDKSTNMAKLPFETKYLQLKGAIEYLFKLKLLWLGEENRTLPRVSTSGEESKDLLFLRERLRQKAGSIFKRLIVFMKGLRASSKGKAVLCGIARDMVDDITSSLDQYRLPAHLQNEGGRLELSESSTGEKTIQVAIFTSRAKTVGQSHDTFAENDSPSRSTNVVTWATDDPSQESQERTARATYNDYVQRLRARRIELENIDYPEMLNEIRSGNIALFQYRVTALREHAWKEYFYKLLACKELEFCRSLKDRMGPLLNHLTYEKDVFLFAVAASGLSSVDSETADDLKTKIHFINQLQMDVLVAAHNLAGVDTRLRIRPQLSEDDKLELGLRESLLPTYTQKLIQSLELFPKLFCDSDSNTLKLYSDLLIDYTHAVRRGRMLAEMDHEASTTKSQRETMTLDVTGDSTDAGIEEVMPKSLGTISDAQTDDYLQPTSPPPRTKTLIGSQLNALSRWANDDLSIHIKTTLLSPTPNMDGIPLSALIDKFDAVTHSLDGQAKDGLARAKLKVTVQNRDLVRDVLFGFAKASKEFAMYRSGHDAVLKGRTGELVEVRRFIEHHVNRIERIRSRMHPESSEAENEILGLILNGALIWSRELQKIEENQRSKESVESASECSQTTGDGPPKFASANDAAPETIEIASEVMGAPPPAGTAQTLTDSVSFPTIVHATTRRPTFSSSAPRPKRTIRKAKASKTTKDRPRVPPKDERQNQAAIPKTVLSRKEARRSKKLGVSVVVPELSMSEVSSGANDKEDGRDGALQEALVGKMGREGIVNENGGEVDSIGAAVSIPVIEMTEHPPGNESVSSSIYPAVMSSEIATTSSPSTPISLMVRTTDLIDDDSATPTSGSISEQENRSQLSPITEDPSEYSEPDKTVNSELERTPTIAMPGSMPNQSGPPYPPMTASEAARELERIRRVIESIPIPSSEFSDTRMSVPQREQLMEAHERLKSDYLWLHADPVTLFVRWELLWPLEQLLEVMRLRDVEILEQSYREYDCQISGSRSHQSDRGGSWMTLERGVSGHPSYAERRTAGSTFRSESGYISVG